MGFKIITQALRSFKDFLEALGVRQIHSLPALALREGRQGCGKAKECAWMGISLVVIFFLATQAFSESPPASSPPTVSRENVKNEPPKEPNQSIEKSKPSGIPGNQTEVVGFSLQGKKLWEKLIINDLDIVVNPSGHRFLPLLRLLKALEITFEEKEPIVSFAPTGSPRVVLDLAKKEIEMNGQARPISLVVGVSEITSQKEIYLSVEVLSEIFLWRIEWEEQNYKFAALTDQKLDIWKTSSLSSLLLLTQMIPTNLPELFPPAHPPAYSLDFIESQIRPYFNYSSAGGTSQKALVIDASRLTFWGNFGGGQYKLQFSHPYYLWDGSNISRGYGSPIMLTQGVWTDRFAHSEIAAGDSVFNLNDLTFPILRMTGVRYNGLGGFSQDDGIWRTSPGISNYFVRPQVFEGTAPVGSKVELVINDRRIEIQEVLVGTYRFENISLTPGTLNLVRIIVTEPSGYQRVSETSIFGRSIHLPQGAVAYLGGMGTNRQPLDWSTRGVFGGGRVLYGLTDSLTLGATWAGQDDFYIPLTTFNPAWGERQYPQSSLHTGGQVTWLPSEYTVLSGDISMSNGSIGSYPDLPSSDSTYLINGNGGKGTYDGLAYKIRGELYPSPKIQINSQFFHYGPNFFDGANAVLRDREGYFVNGRWNINPQWRASSTVGSVWNNGENPPGNTLYVDFQNLEISTNMIPKTTASVGANRISPNWENGPMVLYTLKLQASPFTNANLEAFFSKGDWLDTTKQPYFFNGLRIPNLSTYRPPSVAVSLRVPVTTANTMGAAYWEDPNRNRATILHSYLPPEKPFRMYTQVGYDINYQKPFFDNRLDYLLDRSGKKTIGIQTRYENGDYTVSLLFSFTELFVRNQGVTARVLDSGVTPDRAGVRGRVFIDSNANGIMDPGEPGVENIRVLLDNVNKVLTDKNGYFLLPSIGQSKKSRVFIDIDTVPAIYSPTHAIQTVNLTPSGLTEVNFGITPLNSIAGKVQVSTKERGIQPLVGVRVYLTKMTDDKQIVDSITGRDGDYYLGDIKPGKYYLRVDPETLPPEWVIPDSQKMIEIVPQTEPQEITVPPIIAAEKAKGGEKPSVPPELENVPSVHGSKEVPHEPLGRVGPESASSPSQGAEKAPIASF